MKGGGPSQILRPADLVACRRARHVHDPAFAPRRHPGDHRLREIGGGKHVHFERDAAALQRELDGRLVDRRGRVVHQHVDATVEQLERARDDRGAAVGVCEIRGDRLGAGAVPAAVRERLAEAAGQVVVRLDGTRDHSDARALGGEALGERGADAAATRP